MPRDFENLCSASLEKSYEPERVLSFAAPAPDEHPIIPDECVSIYGQPEFSRLDGKMRGTLARNEVAAAFSVSIRFEDTLIRNLARYVQHSDPLDPGVRYYLHVIEEEARHNRMFVRAIEALGVGGYPAAGWLGFIQHRLLGVIRSSRPLFFLGVLGVEEIVDRVFLGWQRSERTHPLVRDVAKIHRVEEGRHRAFSSEMLEEIYSQSGAVAKGATCGLAPIVLNLIFDVLVPPSVYVRSGVVASKSEAWALWYRTRQSQPRMQLRSECAQPVVSLLRRLGAIPRVIEPIWSASGLAV